MCRDYDDNIIHPYNKHIRIFSIVSSLQTQLANHLFSPRYKRGNTHKIAIKRGLRSLHKKYIKLYLD